MAEQVPSMVGSEHKSVALFDSVLNFFPSTSDLRDVSSADTHDYASGVDAHDHAAADLHSAARRDPATLAPPAHDQFGPPPSEREIPPSRMSMEGREEVSELKVALAVLARELGASSLASIDELRDSLNSHLRVLRVPSLESIDEIQGALVEPRSQYTCFHCGAMCSHEQASAMQKKQRHDVPENLQHDMVDMVAAPADKMVEMVEEKGRHSRVSAPIHSGKSAAKPGSDGESGSNEIPRVISGGQSTLGGGRIWDRFLNRSHDDAASSIISVRACAPSTWATATDSCRALLREVRRKALVAAHHPDIWVTGLLMLVVLLLATLGSLLVWADETTGNMRRHAQARFPPTLPWRQPRGKSQVDLPQMLPPGGSI